MKRSTVSTVVLLAALGGAAQAGPAAPPPAGDRKTAAALFEEGQRDLAAGKTTEACDKLTESVAALPESSAMAALAACDTSLGRLSEAWELWHQLASSAPTAELRQRAAQNAAALDQRLVRVTLRLVGDAPSELAVTLDDKLVRIDDLAVHRVSPGDVTVVATSPDTDPWTKTVNANPGAALTIDLGLIPSRSATLHRRHGRLLGVSIAYVGGLAIGIGAVAGGVAYSDWNGATSSCGGTPEHCKSTGYRRAESQLASARSAARIASWSTGIGLGVAVAGLLTYLQFREPAMAESATEWHATPIAGAQTVGLSLTRSLP